MSESDASTQEIQKHLAHHKQRENNENTCNSFLLMRCLWASA